MLRNLPGARENDQGFTLIELLVVVIVIGILAAIAIPVFLGQREHAYVAAAESDARNAAAQVESYFAEFEAYPVDGTDLVADLGVETSDNVNLYYDRTGASGQTFTIVACHALVDDCTASPPGETVKYDSRTGGIV